MRFSPRSKLSILFSLLGIAAVVGGFAVTGAIRGNAVGAHAAALMHIDCSKGSPICSEVYDSEAVFGEDVYVGHDEPSTLFYSNVPGSGNRMQYQLTLPKDPSPSLANTPGVAYNFQLHPAFWFGMAMCDTQSYPEQVTGCTPDSDVNIVDPAVSAAHPGTAFMEMQFYPPGWVEWPAGNSCDPTKWCAALNIDSLSQNAVTGAAGACVGLVGIEPVNFAFITKNGHPQPSSPPNPLDATVNTFTPNPSADLFMNSGDKLTVTMHDTMHGLQIVIHDQTTGQTGSMTSSAANGFGQVPFSGACNNIPYDFHPMYSTSSEKTRVTWAAHSYNIAFADEIGHFDYCNGTATIAFGGNCPAANKEGVPNDQEPSDSDDTFCFPSTASSLVPVSGCLGTNEGFDGVPYQPLWPDGNTTLHPTSILFTSPLTGSGYNVRYSRVAFEADLPRIETTGATTSPNPCNRSTGVNCTLIPNTDDGLPAAFYPFFSIRNIAGGGGDPCFWQIGNHIPGSKNDFGQNQQYGTLLNLTYTAVGGGQTTRYNDFRQILSKNPC
ncbi:MAG TPA: hypothetical protein VKR83_20505 [Ktedonobacteraceae bacterium]|nr:hypothetical protein [Ktedonobacteraceae bacterium]